METPESIHAFWFGDAFETKEIANAQSALWWSKNDALDAQIKARFEPVTLNAENGTLNHWASSPQGLLSLIILCDQFPRNMYRNTARSFSVDPIALQFCKEGLARNVDQSLREIERVFFYLPLEHSESREDQNHAVEKLLQLRHDSQEKDKKIFENFYQFALKHQAIIRRFGRFPHRNAILGRASTPEELQFLSEPGSSF
jgi:uncharacterized protein (DUF924 family)